jgi:ribosomal protein S18 acetylase RimI-like enzyme
MHFRTAELRDVPALLKLYTEVARQGTLTRTENEITVEYVQGFISKGIEEGLIIVAEHPERPHELVGEIHAVKTGIQAFSHVLTDLTFAVHPNFQKKGLGRSLLTLFLDEVVRTRPDVGKVELFVQENQSGAISLFQSLGFLIEGRLEMRRRSQDNSYEADIPMGWQNPTYEFDQVS